MLKRKRGLLAVLVLVATIASFGLFTMGDAGAASLTTQIQLVVTGSLTNTLDLVTASAPLRTTSLLNMTSGVAANQANVIWSDHRTIAASTTEDLDFAGGGLTDAFGVAVAPAKLRALIVCATATNTNNVVVGGDANSIPFVSAATTTATVQPGGCWVLTAPGLAGIAVTAGTGDILQVANSGAGTSVDYDVVVIGTTS